MNMVTSPSGVKSPAARKKRNARAKNVARAKTPASPKVAKEPAIPPWDMEGHSTEEHPSGAIFYFKTQKKDEQLGCYFEKKKICCKGCVGGHRSSGCIHIGERDMFYVRGAGRPPTCGCPPCPKPEHQEKQGKPRCECITCEICERKLAIKADPAFQGDDSHSSGSSPRKPRASRNPLASRAKTRASRIALAADANKGTEVSSPKEAHSSGKTVPGVQRLREFVVNTETPVTAEAQQFRIGAAVDELLPPGIYTNPFSFDTAFGAWDDQTLLGITPDLQIGQVEGSISQSVPSYYDPAPQDSLSSLEAEIPVMSVENGQTFQASSQNGMENSMDFTAGLPETSFSSSGTLSSQQLPTFSPEQSNLPLYHMPPSSTPGTSKSVSSFLVPDPFSNEYLPEGIHGNGGQAMPGYNGSFTPATTNPPVKQQLSSPTSFPHKMGQNFYPSDASSPSPSGICQLGQSQQLDSSFIAPQLMHSSFGSFEPQNLEMPPNLEQNLAQMNATAHNPTMFQGNLMAQGFPSSQNPGQGYGQPQFTNNTQDYVVPPFTNNGQNAAQFGMFDFLQTSI